MEKVRLYCAVPNRSIESALCRDCPKTYVVDDPTAPAMVYFWDGKRIVKDAMRVRGFALSEKEALRLFIEHQQDVSERGEGMFKAANERVWWAQDQLARLHDEWLHDEST